MAYERFIKHLDYNDTTYNLLKEKAENSKLKEDKDMLDKYIMSEKEKLLKKFGHKVYKDHTSGQYAVNYKGDDGKTHRFKRNEKEKVEEWVIDRVLELEKQNNKENLTIATLFPEFIDYMATEKSKSTIRKYITCYNRFYLPDKDFINKPIALITTIELKKWFNKKIGANKDLEERLTFKCFCEMRKILKGIYELALEEYKIVEKNLVESLSFKSIQFRPEKKKKPEEAIYFYEQAKSFVKECISQYLKYNDSLYLAAIFGIHTGGRVAENCAYKFSDIFYSEKYGGLFLKAQRHVVEDDNIVEIEENGKKVKKTVRNGFKIKTGLKSNKLSRDIPIPNSMIPLLLECYNLNKKRGFQSDGYIFTTNGDFSRPPQLISRTRTVCKHLGFDNRGYHKFRRTYSSILDSIGVHQDTRQRILGHQEDSNITDRYYTYDINKELDRYRTIFEFSLFDNPFDYKNYEFDDSIFSREIQKALKMCLNVPKMCLNVPKFNSNVS